MTLGVRLGMTLALVLHRLGITGRGRCRVLQLRILISQVPESRQRLLWMLWSSRHPLASFSRHWRKRCRRRVLMRVKAKALHFERPAHLGLPSARSCHRSGAQMRKLDASHAIRQPMADMLRALSRPRAQRSSKTRTECNDRNDHRRTMNRRRREMNRRRRGEQTSGSLRQATFLVADQQTWV